MLVEMHFWLRTADKNVKVDLRDVRQYLLALTYSPSSCGLASYILVSFLLLK